MPAQTGGSGSGGGGAGGSATGGAGGGGTGGATGGSGGSATGGAGGATGGGGGSGGAGGSGTGGAGGASAACPASPPGGGACPREGLVCQYGDDPRGDQCRARFECKGGMWNPLLSGCPPVPTAEMCPGSREAAEGQPCKPDGAFCKYGDLQCLCTACPPSRPVCGPSAQPVWTCTSPQTMPGCPNAEPNLGTACTTEGATCSYQCNHMTRICQGGIWTGKQGFGCPISSRAAKREIHYLDPAELRRVSDELLHTRLASWEYRDVALAGKRHLGFIIEDQPGSVAVDRSGAMVDLYSYTSMLVAATQVQAREIERLSRELADLKKQLRRRPSR
jgi:hypothetical protein